MGGGILPMAIYKGKIYFLFSREYWNDKKVKGGNWSDFGGSRENHETYEQTAIREGWEESSGFFGNKRDIKNLIKNETISQITAGGYRTYIVLIKYDKNLPKKFRDDFLKVKMSDPEIVEDHNGLYEKDMLRWISYDDLSKNMKIFRFWYKKIVKLIMKEF